MLLPFGDFPNPSKPQWTTRILIALNVLVYVLVTVPLSRPFTPRELAEADAELLQEIVAFQEVAGGVPTSRYDLFIFQWGYQPGAPSLLTLFSCMFLHAGLLHLVGNMLYLWIFGDNVEERLGTVGYVLAYLGTGVVATLAFALPNGDSLIPLVGASGAISGVLGFYLIWFPRHQIRVLVFFMIITVVHVPARFVLLAYLVIDNLLPYLAAKGGGGGVAFGAHIGGFVAGVVAALVIRRPDTGARPELSPRPRTFTAPVYRDHRAVFEDAVAGRDMAAAAHAFAAIVREGGAPPSPAAVFALAKWLYAEGLVPDAAAVFRYYLKSYPRGEDLDRVHLGLGVLLARRLGQPAAAREHLLQAIDLAEHDKAVQETARTELARLTT